MKLFEITKEILSKILNKELSFQSTLNAYFSSNNLSSEEKRIISNIVLKELRHHLVLEHVIKQYFESISLEDEVTFLVCLVDKLFTHNYQEDELISLLDSRYKGMFHFDEFKNKFSSCLFAGLESPVQSVPTGFVLRTHQV